MSETSEQCKDKGNKYYVQKQYKEAIEGILLHNYLLLLLLLLRLLLSLTTLSFLLLL